MGAHQGEILNLQPYMYKQKTPQKSTRKLLKPSSPMSTNESLMNKSTTNFQTTIGKPPSISYAQITQILKCE